MTVNEFIARNGGWQHISWKSVYFWDLNQPGFAADLFKVYERTTGKSKDKLMEYYQHKVDQYEKSWKEQCRPAGEWLIHKIDESQRERERIAANWMKKKESYQKMSDKELLMLWQLRR